MKHLHLHPPHQDHHHLPLHHHHHNRRPRGQVYQPTNDKG